MKRFKNATIKDKLTTIMMATCIVSLLMAGGVFMFWEWITIRKDRAVNLCIETEMIADNCKAALSFDDTSDAQETLSALAASPSIVFGGIFTNKGDVFATYYFNNFKNEKHILESKSIIASINNKDFVYKDGFLTTVKPIVLEGEKIGTVCLRCDLTPLYAHLKRNTLIISSVLLVASLVAYLMSSGLQKIISGPILKLANTAKVVSDQKKYSIRAVKDTEDEVGTLIDAFNEMLHQIHQRDEALVQSNEQLESRVTERTRELSKTNELLSKEIVVRKHAESKLEEAFHKLKISNAELANFVYVAAHDLRTPLRAIATIADWLLIDYKDNINDQGKEQIKTVISRAKRMNKLLDAVQEYSEIRQNEDKEEIVDLNKVVIEVTDYLHPPQNISITIDDTLPSIKCERRFMFELFDHLLKNAIKYMDKPEGKINIGCIENTDHWEFSVSDNGPGIEEKYFDKIFKIFQILALRDETETTGIGLPIVKKIVEMYNGNIWVKSTPSEGCTFCFTIPKPVDENIANESLKTHFVS